MQQGQKPKYSAAFIMNVDEHGALIDKIELAIDRIALDKFRKKVTLKHRCLKDGNDKPDLDGYGDGTFYLTASRETRPAVVGKDPSVPLSKDDNVLYAGCYVNAVVQIWVQDNPYGKAVNAELLAVQFVKDGDSFGAGPVNAEDEFDNIEDSGGSGSRSSRKAPRGGDDFL